MTRRKIFSLVVLVGGVLLGAKLMSDQEKLASVRITYRLPDGTTRLEVEAVAPEGGEPLARFWATPGADQREVVQKTKLPVGERPLAVTLTVGEETRTSQRTVHVEGDAAITVDLR